MASDSSDKSMFSLLANASLVLPISYGAWFSNSEEVFVSNKLKLLLGVDENLLDPYEFVRLIQNSFGSFLTIAVEKVLSGNDVLNEYSSTIKSYSGEELSLRLVFDTKKSFYLLLIDKPKENSNQNVNDGMLENIINQLPAYIWQRNRDLRIIYCNKKYSDALETTQESVIANNTKLFTPSRKDSYIDQSSYSLKPKNFIEYSVIGGERRALEVTELPFVGKFPSIGFAIDVTAQEEIKKEYGTYKKQTEETLDSVSVPIAIFDDKMKLIFANAASKKLFGFEEPYFAVERYFPEVFDFLCEKIILVGFDNISDYKNNAIKLFTEVVSPHHKSIHLQNGKTLNITISPNHNGGLMFLLEDISDKIALEREVNSVYAVQKETLDQLKEGVFVFGADNRIKMTNPAAKLLWNKPEDASYINMHIRLFFEESVSLFDSDIELELWISKLINMASQRVEFSDTIKFSTGKTIDYAYIPLPDSLHLLRFFDATDKANLEKALREKTEVFSQIDKLKSNLISNISYELSSPLNTIIGFGDILQNQYFGELNSKQKEYCSGIIKSATRLIDVVEAIINLASIESGQMNLKYNDVKLLEFIEESVQMFKSRLDNQSIVVKIDFSDKDFTICLDEQSMRHVIFQTLSKAIKSTPAGGEITISVDVSDSDYITLDITDSGIGFSEEELEKLRSMFENEADNIITDNSLEFGLLLANNIIKLHHGKMSIDSERGSGTSVRFSLPSTQFLI